jgi:hypothetical protein
VSKIDSIRADYGGRLAGGKVRKNCIDLRIGAGVDNAHRWPCAGCFDLAGIQLRTRCSGVHQQRETIGVGGHLMQQLKLLRDEASDIKIHSRQVSARAAQARYKAGPNRVKAT